MDGVVHGYWGLDVLRFIFGNLGLVRFESLVPVVGVGVYIFNGLQSVTTLPVMSAHSPDAKGHKNEVGDIADQPPLLGGE